MKKCICQICSCGRHRCPHTLGQQNRVINKNALNKCHVTEYRGRFDEITPKRGPFHRPTDLIRYEGPTSSQTTNTASYVTHEVKVPKPKEPEKFVPNPHKFDAVSEHHDHYKQLNGIPARIPPYLKKTTMRKPSAKVQYISTKQDDFKPWTSPGRVNIIHREQPYRPPSKPFKETSLHQQDFKRFHQAPNPSARQPDKLNFGDEVDFQTTTQTYHKALKASPTRPIERQPEMQALPKTAFTNTSVFKADFVDHKAIKSAHMFKPESRLFRTNQMMDLQTTQGDSFRVWPVQSRHRKEPDVYIKPEGKIEIMPISRDYSNHGELGIPAKSARPRTKLQRGREFPFNPTTSYSTEFKTYTAPAKRDTLRQNARDGNDIFPKSTEGVEDATVTSEFFDKYKRHQAPPARMFKDNSTLFKSSESFADTSLYKEQFRGERIECPTESLFVGNDKFGLFTFDHVNEEGHKVYEISPRGTDPLRREVTVA